MKDTMEERLQRAQRWIQEAAIHCEEPSSVVYYANRANDLLQDALADLRPKELPAPLGKGLSQRYPCFRREGGDHLLFDGGVDLRLNVPRDCPHRPPVGLE